LPRRLQLGNSHPRRRQRRISRSSSGFAVRAAL
jgi:hypothetical protein